MKKSFLPIGMAICFVMASCDKEDESGISTDRTENNIPSQTNSISQVIGLARIEPEGKIANLSSPVSGIVSNVYKFENDLVKKGDVLLELEHEIEKTKFAKTHSRIATQQAKIKTQESELTKFKTQVENKSREYNRLFNLLKTGSETQQRVDDVETELNVLKASLQGAAANLEMAKAELIEIRKEADLNAAEIEQRFIKAPNDGRILSMDAVMGSALTAQNPFSEFVPKGKLIARAEIDELFANEIAIGQTAKIRLIGSSDIISEGKVIYVSSALKRKSLFSEKAGDQEDRRVREIKIGLTQPESLLINARVECIILTEN